MFKKSDTHTPMMKQYHLIKKDYPDQLLLYRLGDFYEFFYDDAKKAASILNITLTSRGQSNGANIPMCGVPAHSYIGYAKRLLDAGFHLAICEQTELPSNDQKAPLKREVVRIMTPSTVIEEELLNQESKYLAAIFNANDSSISICLCDVSTGEIILQTFEKKNIRTALLQFDPVEIIVSETIFSEFEEVLIPYRKKVISWPNSRFDISNAQKRVREQFPGLNINLDSEQIVCGAIIDYLYLTQKTQKLSLQRPKLQKSNNYMAIDASTFRSLEIMENLSGKKEGSLFHLINQTKTAQGSRLLRERLIAPLVDIGLIKERLDEVDFFFKHNEMRFSTREILSQMPDLERCLTRIALNKGQPKELGQVLKALLCIESLKPLLMNCDLTGCDLLKTTLNKALSDTMSLKNFIKHGFSDELDQQRNFRDKGQQMIEDLQTRYKDAIQYNNLKIKNNGVLGYFIELPRSFLEKVPKNFHIRQTLVNTIRCTTEELKELEEKIIHAEQSAYEIEKEIFVELCEQTLSNQHALLHISKVISRIDVASASAEFSKKHKYVRPEICDSYELQMNESRHPTCEKSTDFIPNDVHISHDSRFQLITGPNMGGKSTYLRQIALNVFLAQIGFYVPCDYAKIGVVDQIFSRIGAHDNLFAGQSTFMVEMSEIANILNNATSKSLVILDEVGRGTATYDGVAIAWAVSEYLLNTLKTKTVFATHFHELTQLAGVKNKTVQIEEKDGDIVFLHKIIDGRAYQSFGIHVAQIAGVPEDVLAIAQRKLGELEAVFKFDFRKAG